MNDFDLGEIRQLFCNLTDIRALIFRWTRFERYFLLRISDAGRQSARALTGE